MASIGATTAKINYANFGAAIEERDRLAKQLNLLNSQNAALEIVSPISGTVLTAKVTDRIGSYLTKGTELIEIADLRNMRARIFISEHDFYKVALNSRIRLQVDGMWRRWDSQLESLAPLSSQMDPALAEENKFKGLRPPNFYVAKAEIHNNNRELKPGMTGEGRIYGPRRSLAGLIWRETRRFLVRKLW